MQRNIGYGINGAVEAVQMIPAFGEQLSYEEALALMMEKNCIRRTLNPDSVITEPEDETEEIKEARTEVSQNLRYLVGNISRIMDYYLARNPGGSFDTMECCGIGAAVLGVTKLLSHELAQEVSALKSVEGHKFTAGEEGGNAEVIYIALFGVDSNSANLMEKAKRGHGRRKKHDGEDIRGAVVVFMIGAIASVILVVFSLGSRLYQTQRQKKLNTEITKNESAETVYNEYNSMQEKYSQYKQMYDYTNTPNESLVAFLQELEQKMPSTLVIENFTSTGEGVSFTVEVENKKEAANTLMQLRKFESLTSVTTAGTTEDESGIVTMSVTAAYAQPAEMATTQQ